MTFNTFENLPVAKVQELGKFSLAKSKQGWSNLWESFSKTLKNFIEAFCNNGMPYELFEIPGSFATIASHQYCVRARKVIKANRIIDGLIGYANCKGGNKQSRVNNPEIPVFGTFSEFSDERTMDGPIYFLTNACQPNCQVDKFGKKGYRVKSWRTIKPGEELTITYGRGYFEARKEPLVLLCCSNRSGKKRSYSRP